MIVYLLMLQSDFFYEIYYSPYPKYLGLLLLLILILVIQKDRRMIFSNWHHLFDGTQFSSQEIYSKMEEGLKQRQIPGISWERVNHSEGNLLSANREYLRVKRNEIFFDICAAPFGTGFFISWWQIYTPNILMLFASRIPFVGRRLLKITYFQVDSETMFKESVHHVVLGVIEDISTGKGIRSLTEVERRSTELRSFVK